MSDILCSFYDICDYLDGQTHILGAACAFIIAADMAALHNKTWINSQDYIVAKNTIAECENS